MKKVIIFLFLFVSIYYFLRNDNKIVIPQESIRFRIVASSNSSLDQDLKWQINEELIPVIMDITSNSKNIDDTRFKITNSLKDIDTIVIKYINNYSINYGENYFPKKEYLGITYPEGNYESLVITLGDGLGDNWWCVLFPPLCLMEAQKDNTDNIIYTTYVQEVIKKYF